MSLFNDPFGRGPSSSGLFNPGSGAASPPAGPPAAPQTFRPGPPTGIGLLPNPAPAPQQFTAPQMPAPPAAAPAPQAPAASPLSQFLMGGSPAGVTGPEVPFSMGAYLNPDMANPKPQFMGGGAAAGKTGPVVPQSMGAYLNPDTPAPRSGGFG